MVAVAHEPVHLDPVHTLLPRVSLLRVRSKEKAELKGEFNRQGTLLDCFSFSARTMHPPITIMGVQRARG